jgi:hypothetical protein
MNHGGHHVRLSPACAGLTAVAFNPGSVGQ